MLVLYSDVGLIEDGSLSVAAVIQANFLLRGRENASVGDPDSTFGGNVKLNTKIKIGIGVRFRLRILRES
jgi:hypothetical protein